MATNAPTTDTGNNRAQTADVSSSIGAYAVRVTQEVGKAMTAHLSKHLDIQRSIQNQRGEQDRNQAPTTDNQESRNSMVSMTVDDFEKMMSVQKKSWEFVADLMTSVADNVQAMASNPSVARNAARWRHEDHLERQKTLQRLGIFMEEEERNPRTPQNPSTTGARATRTSNRRTARPRPFATIAAEMATGNIEATTETQMVVRAESPPPVPCPPPPLGALTYSPYQFAAILFAIENKKLRKRQVEYFKRHHLIPQNVSRSIVARYRRIFEKGILDENRTWHSKGGRPPVCDKAEFLARAEAAMAVHGAPLSTKQIREILVESRKERYRRMGKEIGNI